MATATLPINYQSSTDPRKVAANNRQLIAQQGQNLINQGQQIYGAEQATRGQTADYLSAIEDPLAKGKGGYSPEELAQVRMTPEQQQQMVTSAGISAGAATGAARDAAERAAAASGGNPAAVAAYRARAADVAGANAGDAMTQARVTASNAAATRAENIGQTRIGQQNQGLNYYQGQNAQANQNAQNALGVQQQAYGTETGGMNQAAQTAQAASQNPTTFDKIMGGVGGALKFIEEGDMPEGGTPAVVGENGPEVVAKTKYLDLGDEGSGETGSEGSSLPTAGAGDPNGSGEAKGVSWLNRWRAKLPTDQSQQQQPQQQPQMAPSMRSWNTIGEGAGKLASLFMEDGDMENGNTPDYMADGAFGQPDASIITSPTKMILGKDDAVVPLKYRAGAKIRPSAAMPVLHAMQKRSMYGGQRV